MKKYEKELLLVCGCIGAVLDIVGIVTAFKSSTGVIISVIGILIFICAFLLLLKKYRENCESLQFVEYLYNNKMNVLPKIYLKMNRDKNRNRFNIRNMTVQYTFPAKYFESVTSDGVPVKYRSVAEYGFEIENGRIPEEFSCYLSNACTADGTTELLQKHGRQEAWEKVSILEMADTSTPHCIVQRYHWRLEKEHIAGLKTFPLHFSFQYDGVIHFNMTPSDCKPQTLIFYPWQFGDSIENLHISFHFPEDKIKIRNVDVFKICKSNNTYTHVSEPIQLGDNPKILLHPSCNKHVAYVVKVYWCLTN